MTAFRQVVTKLQESQRDEALIGLEFVLRLDPTWIPLRDDARFQRLLEGMPIESDEQQTPVRVARGPTGG